MRLAAVSVYPALKFLARHSCPHPRFCSLRPRPFVSNVPPTIAAKVGKNLHLKHNHPLNIIKTRVENYFLSSFRDSSANTSIFRTFDNFSPRVNTKACFDDLLVPKTHPSRKITDTFYFSPEECLRTHTSAHQTELMSAGHPAFLVTGDCYRRDEVDATHYPVFHQMEGVRVWDAGSVSTEYVVNDLKAALEGMVKAVFGQELQSRWIDAYFPFTEPSLEMEVFYNEKWLELLGCGVIHAKIMENIGLSNKKGWAFGIGLERLAMVLFQIPDIRLFWSEDVRFLSQFKSGQITKFQSFSKYSPTARDVSLWLKDADTMHENDFCAIVREIAGDLAELVTLLSTFEHPTTKRLSKHYRIIYCSPDRNVTNDEINAIQTQVRDALAKIPSVELR